MVGIFFIFVSTPAKDNPISVVALSDLEKFQQDTDQYSFLLSEKEGELREGIGKILRRKHQREQNQAIER